MISKAHLELKSKYTLKVQQKQRKEQKKLLVIYLVFLVQLQYLQKRVYLVPYRAITSPGTEVFGWRSVSM
jgi:hypothetical protein